MKLFIITGTTRGLGQSLVTQLLNEEELVIEISRKKNSQNPLSLKHDLISINGLEKKLTTVLKKVDLKKVKEVVVVINAAVVTPIGKLNEATALDVEKHLQVNIVSSILFVQLLEKMFSKNKMTIINISSGAATHAIQGWSLYCASKASMEMFFKTLSLDEEKNKKRQYFSFSPGVMDTNMQTTIRKQNKKTFKRHQEFVKLKKENKLLSPETVANKLLNLVANTKKFKTSYNVNELMVIPFLLLSSMLFSGCNKTPVTQVSNKTLRTVSSVERGEFFEEITKDANLPEIHSSSLVVGDYNRDWFPDFIARDRLYHNTTRKGKIEFQDVTEQVGLKGLSGLPMFMDVNNDGELDIVTTKGMVFIQSKGKFKNLTAQYQLDLPADVNNLSFFDYNRDGYADLVIGLNEIHKDNQFSFQAPMAFINSQGQKFVRDTVTFPFEANKAYNRGIHWADYDLDGFAEAYFSNYRLRQNFLFKKSGKFYVDQAPKVGIEGENNNTQFYDEYYKKTFGPKYGHTISSAWADFNNDGYLDLWVSNLVHKFVGLSKGAYDYRGYVCDDSKIYKNMGAPDFKMKDVRNISGIPLKPMGDFTKYKGDELWAQTALADYDNDGLLDVYLTQVYNLNYAHALLYRNTGAFKFVESSKEEPIRLLDNYAAVWGDFNNDGQMDLLASGRPNVNIPHRLHLFENIAKTKNNWVKVRLIGMKSGKNPVATQVKILLDDGIVLRQYDGVNGSYNQQSDSVLHFGIGANTKIKGIEVRWSSGYKNFYSATKINTAYVLKELQ